MSFYFGGLHCLPVIAGRVAATSMRLRGVHWGAETSTKPREGQLPGEEQMDATHEVRAGAAGGFGILQLRKYIELFRGEEQYQQFTEAIQRLADPGTIAV